MRIRISKLISVCALLSAFLLQNGHAAELKAFVVKQCPNSPVKAPGQKSSLGLGAILIPQLISAGVDLAATALSEAAKTKTVTFVADSNVFDMYSLGAGGDLTHNEEVGCLIVYLPADKDAKKKSDPAPLSAWFKKVADNTSAQITEQPDVYIEFELRSVDPDSSKLLIVPQLLAVSRPIQEGFTRKKQRGYVFALSFKDEASQTSYGAASFTFEDMPIGAWTRDGRNETKEAQWPSIVAIAKLPQNEEITSAVAAQKSKASPYRAANALLKQHYQETHPVVSDMPPDAIFDPDFVTALRVLCSTLDKAGAGKPASKMTDERCPVDAYVAKRDFARAADKVTLKVGTKWANDFLTKKCVNSTVQEKDGPLLCKLPPPGVPSVGASQVSVSVVETAEASEFIQGLAKAFNGKKEDIKTSLNDQLNPARKEELALAAATKEVDARNAYRVAILDVQQIDAQLEEATGKPESNRATIRTQLAQAKIEANKAARTAGLTVPYPEFD